MGGRRNRRTCACSYHQGDDEDQGGHGRLDGNRRLASVDSAWSPARDCFASSEREWEVSYGVVHHFAGGTKEQYDASIAAVHPSGGGLPEGQLFHAAGPSADGWTIVAIHDSQENWEKFRDETLMPRMAAGIEGGFTVQPTETGFPVHNQESA
jgi:hypothetical protein